MTARLAGALRAVSGLAWLIAALAFFWVPLGWLAGSIDLDVLDFSRPSPGFMLRVLSTPSGADVRIDGQDRGSAPLFTNVACTQGQPVTIQVVKAGYAPWERTVECREEQTLLVQPRLGGPHPPKPPSP